LPQTSFAQTFFVGLVVYYQAGRWLVKTPAGLVGIVDSANHVGAAVGAVVAAILLPLWCSVFYGNHCLIPVVTLQLFPTPVNRILLSSVANIKSYFVLADKLG